MAVLAFALLLGVVSALQPSHVDVQALSLIQLPQRAKGLSPGSAAPITEHGYQLVASLKSDDEMKAFIHRVLEKEARYVVDKSELNGIVPYYSGTQAVQDLDTMKKELRKAAWVAVGEGRTAALSEVGYQQIAHSNHEMKRPHMLAFARRILNAAGKVVTDEGALSGLMMWHDGEIAVQTYDRLRDELLRAEWVADKNTLQRQLIAKALGPEENKTVANVNEASGQQEELDESLSLAFEGFDLDGSSRLSALELKQALKTVDKDVSDDTVEEMLLAADTDGNGEIDAKEFKAKLQD